ncbi:hypothetical protein QBC33DRAFT_525877, partial [Phialemonium atrogriseum]
DITMVTWILPAGSVTVPAMIFLFFFLLSRVASLSTLIASCAKYTKAQIEHGGMVDWQRKRSHDSGVPGLVGASLHQGMLCVVEGHLSHFQPSSCICFLGRDITTVSARSLI